MAVLDSPEIVATSDSPDTTATVGPGDPASGAFPEVSYSFDTCERLYVHTYGEVAEREVKAVLGTSAPQLRVVRDTSGTQPVAETA